MGPLMICNAVEVIIRVYEAYEVYEASGPMGSTGGQGEGVSWGHRVGLMSVLMIHKAYMLVCRMAEVGRGTGGPRRKVWTQTKILSRNICYFVAN